MFTDLVDSIRQGELPDHSLLAKRFHVALTKKLAVVKLPPAFWTADPKINPRTDHLLWAAILLDDNEGYDLVQSIIATEIVEKTNSRDLETELREKTRELLDSLYTTAPSSKFRDILINKTQKILFRDSRKSV